MNTSTQKTSREVPLEDLRAGMKLSEPVVDSDSGDTLLNRETDLSTQDIQALKDREIYRVSVDAESYERHYSEDATAGESVQFSQDELEELAADVLQEQEREEEQKKERRREFYNRAIDQIRVLFEDARSNRNFDISGVRDLVEQVNDLLLDQTGETIKMTRMRNDVDYLLSHSLHVTILGMHLGRELEFSPREIKELGLGCMLHDIGMSRIPRKLLEKNDPLTDNEFEVIQRHPHYKKEWLEETQGLSYLARSVVLQHHERMDGSGYPEGLANGEISKYARVAAVADAYEAMVSPRVYRDRKSSYEAMQVIVRDAGTKFWEKAARRFFRSLTVYPIGSVVRLNDNSTGVVHQATSAPLRPVVKLLLDDQGNELDRSPELNLYQNQNHYIQEVLDEV